MAEDESGLNAKLDDLLDKVSLIRQNLRLLTDDHSLIQVVLREKIGELHMCLMTYKRRNLLLQL